MNLGLKHWIQEMRSNCQCDLPDCWIEKNLISWTSQKLVKPMRSTKLNDAAVSSRDIRLKMIPPYQLLEGMELMTQCWSPQEQQPSGVKGQLENGC